MNPAACSVVGRYAPSPTGPLHLGNLRTALICWLQARLAGGRMILRMDDLDTLRNIPGSAEQILDDLVWLGLDHDGEVAAQSARTGLYTAAFEQLRDAGAIFPCRCSRRDIEAALSAPDQRFPTARYPGTCRPENDPPPFDAEEPVAWRFLVSPGDVTFTDAVLGRQSANLVENPGDFVVRRKDGIFAYQLASVVDDGELGVSDVVRGADLLDSSARQIALFEALGYSVPRFWHVPLMTDESGQKLSKRDGSESLGSLRENGADAEAVVGMLAASLSLCEPGERLSARSLAFRHTGADLATLLHTTG